MVPAASKCSTSPISIRKISERIVSSPVSPLGQRTRIQTKYATEPCACPATLALDPARQHLPKNEEHRSICFTRSFYISDREEGLVLATSPRSSTETPDNNF